MKITKAVCGLVFVFTVFFVLDVRAQDNDNPMPDFTTKSQSKEKEGTQLDELPPDVPVADYVEGTPQSKRQYIYEKPTMKNLANFYWAVGYADLENDQNIDDYLKLTECKIFSKFSASEFEMREIREATRKFITDNRSEFSSRFELAQKITLEDYDIKRKAFKISRPYQIHSIRRFEMFTTDDFKRVSCGHRGIMEGFPTGLMLELSRPFTITYVPVPEDLALAYIDEKTKFMTAKKLDTKNKSLVYEIRTAYIVMYVKGFAFRKLEASSLVGQKFLQTMAVLEGVDVYADVGRKQLFYSKSFLSNVSPTEVSENLRKEYEILNERYKGLGLLH